MSPVCAAAGAAPLVAVPPVCGLCARPRVDASPAPRTPIPAPVITLRRAIGSSVVMIDTSLCVLACHEPHARAAEAYAGAILTDRVAGQGNMLRMPSARPPR